ncbi:MAG: DUF4296 domain-containing protein [Saprospiraceae bacterium]|nr:DUF4296 domain-containing protein [Saprospiraceae bacterium]
MNKQIALVLRLLPWFFLAACQPKTEQPVLSDEKIARVMADLYLADGAANGLPSYQRDSLAQKYYAQVMELHGLTKAAYEKELRLRASDLTRMQGILKQVEELLKKKDPKQEKKEGEGPPK